jgi:hypothetical protein
LFHFLPPTDWLLWKLTQKTLQWTFIYESSLYVAIVNNFLLFFFSLSLSPSFSRSSSSPPPDNINPDGDADGDANESDLKPRWRRRRVRFETHMGFCSTWFGNPLGSNPLVLSAIPPGSAWRKWREEEERWGEIGKKMCGWEKWWRKWEDKKY